MRGIDIGTIERVMSNGVTRPAYDAYVAEAPETFCSARRYAAEQ